jgi:hypothetical protein
MVKYAWVQQTEHLLEWAAHPTKRPTRTESAMLDQINRFANSATTTVNDNLPKDFRNDFLGAVTDSFTQTSDRVLDTVVDTNRRVVEFAVTTADRVADQFSLDLPLGDRLPTPEEAGKACLDFVERAVSMNREMNERIVEMLKVDAPKVVTTAARTTPAKTTTAKKATAKKATARKTTARKTTARKTTARKTTAKKTTARKAPASKAVASA